MSPSEQRCGVVGRVRLEVVESMVLSSDWVSGGEAGAALPWAAGRAGVSPWGGSRLLLSRQGCAEQEWETLTTDRFRLGCVGCVGYEAAAQGDTWSWAVWKLSESGAQSWVLLAQV